MADGFGAVGFDVMQAKPFGSDRAEVTEWHIPGGSVNYLDIGGKLPNHIDLLIKLANATDYASLRALVSTQATLTAAGVAYTNTLLLSLQRTRINPVFCDASFVTP